MLYRVAIMPTLAVIVAIMTTLSVVRWAGADEVAFTTEYLKNPDNIALGRQVWSKRCIFCHGRSAYPGKAPRLEPSRYTPGFVYDRVTNGFRGMPAWKQEFSEQERKAVVAYVLSKRFPD